MQQTVYFSIEGEFITNLAREKFYHNHQLTSAIDLLWSATETDQLTKEEHLILCLEIIAGKKNIVGVYPGDDYGVEEVENKNSCIKELFKNVDEQMAKVNEKEEELKKLYQKLSFILSELDDWKIRSLNNSYKSEYGENLFDNPPKTDFQMYLENQHKDDTFGTIDAVDSYLSRVRNTKEHTTADYGWLAPDGTFYEVEWGEHSGWAEEYCKEHYPNKDCANMYWKDNDDGTRRHLVNGDFLVYVLHWVLLDSPYQGIATPKYDPVFGMTKAQKEFLYDYYTERNRTKEANEIWSDD